MVGLFVLLIAHPRYADRLDQHRELGLLRELCEAQNLLARIQVDAVKHRVHSVREQISADESVLQRDLGLKENGREKLGREAKQRGLSGCATVSYAS